MVLCYEKKTLCSSCKTDCCSLFIKVLNFLSSVTQFIHSTSLKQFCICNHPVYFVLLLHMLSTFVRTPTNRV